MTKTTKPARKRAAPQGPGLDPALIGEALASLDHRLKELQARERKLRKLQAAHGDLLRCQNSTMTAPAKACAEKILAAVEAL